MSDAAKDTQFETLYAENAGRLYRFALRLSGSREEAEDLAAEAFAEAYRKWGAYRGAGSPSSWLCAIVLNRWRMQRRKRRVPVDPLHAAAEVASTFRFLDMDLAYALAALPASLRIAFLLVKSEGFTHAEAARALRVPVGTVYFRVHVAIRRLRSELDPNPRSLSTKIEVTCDHEL